MEDLTDYGIAVANAIPLNDCCYDLTVSFAAQPALDADCTHNSQTAPVSQDHEDWAHRVNSRNVAQILIRQAILNKSLNLWIRLGKKDEIVDANAISKIEHKTLASGRYLTHNHPKSFLEGRPLWIKQVEWSLFKAATMRERYGNKHLFPEQNSPVASMFAIWRDEAFDDFELERDGVNSTFSKAGRTQSAYHIRGLVTAAEKTVMAVFAKARDLPLPDQNFDSLESHSVSILEELAEQIREIVIGANGRSPQPDNTSELDKQMEPVRKRIAQECEKLRLKAQFAISEPTFGNTARAPSVKTGRPPSDDDILAKADKMKARGLSGREIAKKMRYEPGYEHVGTTLVRDLTKGRWPQGRPKKST